VGGNALVSVSVCLSSDNMQHESKKVMANQRANTGGVLHSKTGRVSCVCDWLRDATGLDFGGRSWICNAAPMD